MATATSRLQIVHTKIRTLIKNIMKPQGLDSQLLHTSLQVSLTLKYIYMYKLLLYPKVLQKLNFEKIK